MDDNHGPGSPARVEAFLLGHPSYGLQVEGHGPLGWDQLTVDALFAIKAVSKSTGVKIQIGQMKENFGGLRIYAGVDEPSATEFELAESQPIHDHFQHDAAPGSARGRASERRCSSTACEDRLRNLRWTGDQGQRVLSSLRSARESVQMTGDCPSEHSHAHQMASRRRSTS